MSGNYVRDANHPGLAVTSGAVLGSEHRAVALAVASVAGPAFLKGEARSTCRSIFCSQSEGL